MTNSIVSKLSDEELVQQFKATADPVFFGEIYKRYNHKVYLDCLSILKDPNTAQDVAQDVMIRVMQKLPTLQCEFLLGIWIHKIARNESISCYNKWKKRPLVQVDKYLDLAAEETEEGHFDDQENLLEGMNRAIEKLNEDTRTMLTLKYLHNTSIKVLQQKYSLSESAIKMRLARARSRIAKLYYQSQNVRQRTSPSISRL